MCVVKECRELEESFSTQLVDRVMRGNTAIARKMKETTYQEDRQTVVDRCWVKAPVLAEVARRVGWARLNHQYLQILNVQLLELSVFF